MNEHAKFEDRISAVAADMFKEYREFGERLDKRADEITVKGGRLDLVEKELAKKFVDIAEREAALKAREESSAIASLQREMALRLGRIRTLEEARDLLVQGIAALRKENAALREAHKALSTPVLVPSGQ